MKAHFFYVLLMAGTSSCAFANIVATPENEDICKQNYVKAVFDQQVRYSNTHNNPQVRRTAERHIDRSRQLYNETNSFCSALDYLLNDAPQAELEDDFQKAKPGESQFK